MMMMMMMATTTSTPRKKKIRTAKHKFVLKNDLVATALEIKKYEQKLNVVEMRAGMKAPVVPPPPSSSIFAAVGSHTKPPAFPPVSDLSVSTH